MTEELIEEGNSRLDALLSQIAKRRWNEELRGVAHAGIRWQADPESRLAVLETLQFADMVEAVNGPGTFKTNWKGMRGQWASNVAKSDLLDAGRKIGERRAACFAREKELVDLAMADPDGFDETVIGAGWPPVLVDPT